MDACALNEVTSARTSRMLISAGRNNAHCLPVPQTPSRTRAHLSLSSVGKVSLIINIKLEVRK